MLRSCVRYDRHSPERCIFEPHADLTRQAPTPASFDVAEAHYTNLSKLPHIITGTIGFAFLSGLIGHIIKLHKGKPDKTSTFK